LKKEISFYFVKTFDSVSICPEKVGYNDVVSSLKTLK